MWIALYKKELCGFFYNRSAYFIMAVYIVMSLVVSFFLGLYFVVDNPSMRSYFVFQPQVLMMIVPAMTMRLWAEENKIGTIEILLTLPFNSFTLVTAKFMAAWTLAGILLLMSLPLMLSTAFLVHIDTMNIAAAYGGTFLAAGVLVALGCAVSALTSLPTTAYLSSVLLGWLLINFNFTSLVAKISARLPDAPFFLDNSLNFSNRYQGFVNGQFSVDSFLYFISLITVLLVFNCVSIVAKRSGK